MQPMLPPTLSLSSSQRLSLSWQLMYIMHAMNFESWLAWKHDARSGVSHTTPDKEYRGYHAKMQYRGLLVLPSKHVWFLVKKYVSNMGGID
jgi:hypothetical protein